MCVVLAPAASISRIFRSSAQLGVAQVLLAKDSRWAQRFSIFAGASGGALAATVCALLPHSRIADFAKSAGCRGESFNALADALAGAGAFPISAGAAEGATAKQSLFLSATHCRTGTNALFSRFGSNAKLQRCLLASAAIPSDFHPFDLLQRGRRPTYAEAGGIIVPPDCESDGGLMAAVRDARTDGTLPFSPHGEAYVDGGITNTAPLLAEACDAHTLTVSPIGGPQGCLQAPSASQPGHYHLAPLDQSLRVPGVAPRLAGMRCYLSVDSLRALRASVGASPRTLKRWYECGVADAEQFLARHEAPPDT